MTGVMQVLRFVFESPEHFFGIALLLLIVFHGGHLR